MPAVKDLVGQKFVRLTVVKRVENNKHGQSRWLCKCDCGNNHTATQGSLVNSLVKSCGCLQSEISHKNGIINGKASYKDLTSKKFGELTVIRRVDNKGRHVQWLCKCTCGRTKIISSNHLLDGNTRSCGCLITQAAKENQKKAAIAGCIDGTKIGSLTMKTSCTNSSGYKGVRWHKAAQKWNARITFKGKEIYLGLFDRLDDAIEARKKAEEKYFNPIIELINK